LPKPEKAHFNDDKEEELSAAHAKISQLEKDLSEREVF
jgi:hypothetical protein